MRANIDKIEQKGKKLDEKELEQFALPLKYIRNPDISHKNIDRFYKKFISLILF